MEKYKIIKILGDGSFGTVYKAIDTHTKEVFAIKKFKSKYSNWSQCVELRQVKSLRKLTHPNIVKLKEVLLVSEQLYMVFEYVESNLYEVYSKLKSEGKSFSEKEIKCLMIQLVSALAYMHKHGFFHRDLKPENILYSSDGVVKICDFGLARQIRSRPPYTQYVSTRWYRSPQLLLRSTNYNSPVDVFALACIMAELYNLAPLFPGNNELDQMNKIVKVLGTPEKADYLEGYKLAQAIGFHFNQEHPLHLSILIPLASEDAISLMANMLQYSSRKRMTMAEILKHQYFDGVKSTAIQANQIPKQIIIQETKGQALDTFNEDKNINVFRATKEKFRETRKHDALLSNPFKNIEKQKKHNNEDFCQDIDSILAEFEEKKKKKQVLVKLKDRVQWEPTNKIGLKASRQRFYTHINEEIETKQSSPYDYMKEKEKGEFRYRSKPIKNSERNAQKKSEEIKPLYFVNLQRGLSRKQKQVKHNPFSYNFQPTSLPHISPQLHENSSNLRMQFLNPVPQFQFHKFEANQKNKMKPLKPLISPFRY